MELTIQTMRVLTITLTDDHENGIYEINAFLSSLPKIKKAINKVGFANKFTREEREVWNDLFNRYEIKTEKNDNIN